MYINEINDALAKVSELGTVGAMKWLANAIGGAKQAEIDRLMLEFCPDEMTAEQKASWAASQRVAAPQGIGWGLKNIPLFYDNKTGPADAAPATSLIENAARQYVAAVNDPYTSTVGEQRWFNQLEAAIANQPSPAQKGE